MKNNLQCPFDASVIQLATPVGNLALLDGVKNRAARRPLLLIHSVNAAASSFEVKPIFEFYRSMRPVYALDLPGFGLSERQDRPYNIQTMTEAILAATTEIQKRHNRPIDALAVSLSCEFLARAALGKPESFRSLGLISPTGFEGKARDQRGKTSGREWQRQILNFPPWRRRLFALLTTKAVIRKFLEKTWGSKNIDEQLLEYDYLTAHQLGAEHAPYYFVSGFLFSKDILNLYGALTHPVWMVRGTRGDFVDYHHLPRVSGNPNWTIEVLNTGAFPHFELLLEVTSSFDTFLESIN